MLTQVAPLFIYFPSTLSSSSFHHHRTRITLSHDNTSQLFTFKTASASFIFTQRSILIDNSSRWLNSRARWIGSQPIVSSTNRPGSRHCQVGLRWSRATVQTGSPRCQGHLSTHHLVVTRLVFSTEAASARLRARNSRTNLVMMGSRRMSLASSRYHFFVFFNLRNKLTFLSDY